jgi:hypothetical protein
LELPAGAVLEGDDKLTVACRPGAAVVESMRPPSPPPPWWKRVLRWLIDPERLPTVKLVLEVLAVLVGLVGAVLAVFGLSRK